MFLMCAMFLTAVAAVQFVSEVDKEKNPVKMIVFGMNILALAYIFKTIG